MGYLVELSRRAERDLHSIFGSINTVESFAAAKWFEGLTSHIQTLVSLQDRGTLTGYDPKLRYRLYGRKPHVYRILYRVSHTPELVRIVHIRHGARAPLG